MTDKRPTNLDDLVQRQASILAEIDNLNDGELESFANSPLPEDAVSSEIKKARKLLRGLLRTGNVGSGDLKITSERRPTTRVSSRRRLVFSLSIFCRCPKAASTPNGP